jgi:predicted HTH transcriptional regulator
MVGMFASFNARSACLPMSAFANTLGGQLIFGVAYNGECVGLEQPAKGQTGTTNANANAAIPTDPTSTAF